jgi:hypothetical protein
MWLTCADWSFLVMIIKLVGHTCFVQVVDWLQLGLGPYGPVAPRP